MKIIIYKPGSIQSYQPQKQLTGVQIKEFLVHYSYRPINHDRWIEYLEDPFNFKYTDSTRYMEALGPDLVN